VWDHHGDDGNDSEHKFERDIRTRVQVSQKKCQNRGHRGRPHHKNDRVDDDLDQCGIGVSLDILVQGEFSKGAQARGKTPEDQHDDGAHGQKADNDDQDGRQDRSFVDHGFFPILSGDQKAMVRINSEVCTVPHLDIRVWFRLDKEL